MAHLPFDDEAPVTDERIWRDRVNAVLKGADFDEKLVSRTADGIRIEPLYQMAGASAPVFTRPATSPWTILQRVDDPDPVRANEQALNDLENGASGLTLVFEQSIGAYGFGLPATSETLAKVLKGVYLDAGIDIALDCGPRGRDAAHAFADAVRMLGVPPNLVRARFGLNPVGTGARLGALPGEAPAIGKNVAAAVNDLVAQGFAGPFIAADGRVVHAAGGSEAQELAFVLASALFYLRALETSGIPLEDARAMIEFRLASDADQFLSIAKHRALRRLWAGIEAECGLEPAPILLTSETAFRMMTRRDAYLNLLRAGMGTFAAAIGGADSITVLPFTTALGLPDAFARRLARNTQTLLAEEAHLGAVADPAAGAGSYEALTGALVDEAWQAFRTIETEGGIVAALRHGALQTRIATVKATRHDALMRKDALIIGVTAFPDPDEKPVAVLEPAPPVSAPAAPAFAPLTSTRLSEPFESQEGTPS